MYKYTFIKMNYESGKYRLYNENNELLGERDTAQEILILFTSISGHSWKGGK